MNRSRADQSLCGVPVDSRRRCRDVVKSLDRQTLRGRVESALVDDVTPRDRRRTARSVCNDVRWLL
ncbi:hypothetical protein D8S78_01985 [Natrialba swarupiae]|nr:hypothetical protein [Natrialba swarupiae]